LFTTTHSLHVFGRALSALWLALLVSACVATSTQPAAGVTFSAPVPVEEFSPKATLQVLVWNAEQLAALNQQTDCVIAHDVQTGSESIHCPPGVVYQKITPEEFVFPVLAIDKNIQVTSRTVKIGEKYQIRLGGLSSDDCNSTSAVAEGTATSSTIKLGSLVWATTAMACVKP
jgi:hypothetical protein